jgi:hypothetical protein
MGWNRGRPDHLVALWSQEQEVEERENDNTARLKRMSCGFNCAIVSWRLAMNLYWLYFLLIGFSAVGIAYAFVVLKFWVHWTKNGPRSGASLIAWQFLIITPIGWALYLALKPWRTYASRSSVDA